MSHRSPEGGSPGWEGPEDDPRPARPPHPERPAPRAAKGWVIGSVLVGVLLLIVAGLVVAALSGNGPGGTSPTTSVAAEHPAGSVTEPAAGEGQAERQVTDRPLTELLDGAVPGTDFRLGAVGWTPYEDAVARGAAEAVTGLYTDGEREVVATAAAFDSIPAQDAYAESLVEEQPSQDLTSEGTVYSDESGRYWAFEHDDGAATIIWRSDTGVVLSVAGPVAAAQEVFANMTI